MRIFNENEILDISKRKQLIVEIEGAENRRRKAEAYRRYLCFKDRTNVFVTEQLLRMFSGETVNEMQYGLSNVSIVRKIVDKLARVYANGAERSINNPDKNEAGEGGEQQEDENTEKLQKISQVLNVNAAMKKTNRFTKLQRNSALYIKPVPQRDEAGLVKAWGISLEPLSPFSYDVVEDPFDRTKPMVFVLSDYEPTYLPGMAASYAGAVASIAPVKGNNIDEKIADTPSDQKADPQGTGKEYIFWSKNYHFTCDAEGNILKNASGSVEVQNDFGLCPVVPFAIDQDGSFWAEGGDDLVDGAVLVNAVITHTMHAGVTQGYGQFWATGENVPAHIKLGPSHMVRAEYKDGEPEPKFGFLNANPQLADLRGCVEMYVALLLTTNNLSTTGVSTQLSGSASLASGIALVIDKADSLEDVEDQRQLFVDKEPEVFAVINAILTAYGDLLDEPLKGLALPEGVLKDFSLRFNPAPVIMSETERIAALKARKDLGIDSMVDLIMRDDPSLTREQAEQRLMQILEEKIKLQLKMKEAGLAPETEEGKPGEQPKPGETKPPAEENEDDEGDSDKE